MIGHEGKVQVVGMRFFGGLSVEETSEVLKLSPMTVMRDWNSAKAWLYRELENSRCSSALGAPMGLKTEGRRPQAAATDNEFQTVETGR